MVDRVKDLRLKPGQRDAQKARVGLDQLQRFFRIARIHAQKNDLEGDLVVAADLLKQLGHRHGILAAGDADRDLIPRLYQLIVVDRPAERRQQPFVEGLADAPFDLLELNGESFQTVPFKKKYATLKSLFNSDFVRPVEMRPAKSAAEVETIFNEWVTEGGAEGIVVHSELPFIWKVKPRHTLDAALIGFTTGDQGVRDLMFAVRREDGMFQPFGVASNGLSDDDRRTLLPELKKSAVDSTYIQTDSRGIAYQMVKPERVCELSVSELVSENSRGKIKWNPLLALKEDGWLCEGQTPGVYALGMTIVGRRDDKTPEPSAIRVSQLSDICPFGEAKAVGKGRPSELLLRRVCKKVSGAKTMVQKFVIWKTNKEETGIYPAYVFHYTDYSASRKEALKRDLRVSSSEEQIRRIMDDFIGENIKKGWEEVL